MKSPWQQFQQQQQQQRQRMQQGAAWMEEQKRRQQQIASQSPASQAQKQVHQRFSQADQEAARLRQQFAAGKLTQEGLENKLRELMVQDAGGTWWMVGTESGRWYRHDGQNWVQGTPPGHGGAGIDPSSPHPPSIVDGGSKLKALIIFVLGSAVSVALFFAAGSTSYNIIRDMDAGSEGPASVLIASVVGLTGLVFTWRKARRAARGY